MASIEAYEKKDGTKMWLVRGRKPDGSQHTKRGFARKIDARAYAEEFETSKRRGAWVDAVAARRPFEEWAKRYLRTKLDVRAGTMENVEGRIRTHLAEFDRMPLSSIRHHDVLEWRAGLVARGLAPATINSALGTLRQVFRFALNEGAISRNPADGVKALPAGPGGEPSPLTRSQVIALADEIGRYVYRGRVDPRYRTVVLFVGLGSGLRPGELWALRWDRVDLDGGMVRVVQAVSEEAGGMTTKPPKSGKPRTVRVDPTTVDLLRKHRERFSSESGLVFTTSSGAQVRHHNFLADVFGPAVRRMGDRLPAGFRFYDLRHTHASLLIADGWRPDQVKDRLGHGSIRTTLDWYGHLFPGHDDGLLVALAEKNREALASD